MDYRKSFEEIIRRDPRDLTTRKVYADWLEEFGGKPGDDDLAVHHRDWTLEKQDAKEWMEAKAIECGRTCLNYYSLGEACDKWRDITYEDLLNAGRWHIDNGDYFVQAGTETCRDIFSNPDTLRQYWKYWSLLTGNDLNDREDMPDCPFSCSC